MKKNWFLIVLAITALFAIGLGVYGIIDKEHKTPVTLEGVVIKVEYQETPEGNLRGGVIKRTTIKFSDGRVVTFPNIIEGKPIIEGKNNMITYNQEDGIIMEIVN